MGHGTCPTDVPAGPEWGRDTGHGTHSPLKGGVQMSHRPPGLRLWLSKRLQIRSLMARQMSLAALDGVPIDVGPSVVTSSSGTLDGTQMLAGRWPCLRSLCAR
jgi:hypothetical protein